MRPRRAFAEAFFRCVPLGSEWKTVTPRCESPRVTQSPRVTPRSSPGPRESPKLHPPPTNYTTTHPRFVASFHLLYSERRRRKLRCTAHGHAFRSATLSDTTRRARHDGGQLSAVSPRRSQVRRRRHAAEIIRTNGRPTQDYAAPAVKKSASIALRNERRCRNPKSDRVTHRLPFAPPVSRPKVCRFASFNIG